MITAMPPNFVEICAVNLTVINAHLVLLGVNKDHAGMG